MKKITIIGAGIGGLTTAIALKQKGFKVEIFENTPKFKKAGSGINLAINAMQVYKRLGIYNEILQNASYVRSMNIRTKRLGLMASVQLNKFDHEFGVKAVAIHRATLHKLLLSHLGDTPIYLNKKLKSLKQSNGKVYLNFMDESHHIADIVIGADGIHSVVRQSIVSNSELRDAEQICWRGISTAKFDRSYKGELNEIWGKGNRFGFVHINQKEVYWFALINKNRFTNPFPNLLDIFSDYHPTVQQIIKETPKKSIICNEIWDLKPITKWYQDNVCLLGDAGHATTPNMGQGAVQAVESAMVLGICLAEENNIENAFSKYQEIRKKKANRITDTSWRMGKMAQMDNLFAVRLRNLMLKMTPNYLMDKHNRKVYQLNY